jgi:hypothetical protein
MDIREYWDGIMKMKGIQGEGGGRISQVINRKISKKRENSKVGNQ